MRIWFTVLAAISICPAFCVGALPPAREIRALWVTRGEFKSADDVKKVVANAAKLNFNLILFQVRGNGTVYYKSKIEPWAFELTSKDPATTGKDPGWDPLRVAIDEARRRGIELHAWINVFPAWRSQRFPPQDSKQLWWTRPDWFMHDAAGERMIPRDRRANPKVEDWYSFLSPGVPAVQIYLAVLAEELVTNYDVGGVHYDYIRYPREIREVKEQFKARAEKLGNWSYDPTSLERFTRETGVAQPDDDPEKWMQWRADQVTATVQKMGQLIRSARPQAIITAAVGADPADSRRGKAQSYVEWMDKRLVDGVFLMGYTDDPAKFEKQTRHALSHKPSKGFMSAGMGLTAGPEIVIKEIETTRNLSLSGFAYFSYNKLFDTSADHKPRPIADKLKAGVLSAKAALPWREAKATKR
jgi:uncharacterized lipoprotein YddW (UPF0748 family)